MAMHLIPPMALIISTVARSISAMQSHKNIAVRRAQEHRALADAESGERS